MEYGTGFFGFEVGEIYLFFLFHIFRHIFSILALNFGIYIFSIYFSVWLLLFFVLLDIFISARKYRIAPSTVDGRVYFHSRISYVGIRFFFQVNLSILRHFSSLFPFI